MNRLFGSKNTAPKPTLNDAVNNIEERVGTFDVKLSKINSELTTYQQKISRMRDGPGKSALKQRALKFLFFYKSDNNENDLWINRGRPSKLFRISYDKQIPRKVVEFEPTIDYLNNNERQADQWLLEKLLREI